MHALKTDAVFLMFSCAKSIQSTLQLLLEDVGIGNLDEGRVRSDTILVGSTTVLRHLSRMAHVARWWFGGCRDERA